MALEYKQQAADGVTLANTDQTLFTVPANQNFVGQVLIVNQDPSNNRTFKIAIVAGGGAPAAEDYIWFNAPTTPHELLTINGLTLEGGDEIHIESDKISNVTPGTGVVFQVYGEVQT